MPVRAMYSATNEGLLSPQSTDVEDELQSVTEDDLHSQGSSWSPTEGETEEELEPLCSATKEEQSVTEEGPDTEISQESFLRFLLINIWNVPALKETVKDMFAGFQQSATFVIANSPSASNCSSPLLYEHDCRAASVNDENNDQHLHFIPYDTLDIEYIDRGIINEKILAQFGAMIKRQIVNPGNPQILRQVFEANSAMLNRYFYDHLTSAGLSIDKWTCMGASEFNYQSANDCFMNLEIATRMHRLMWRKLAEAECESFSKDLRVCYFELCARRLEDNLIMAADSISNLEWPVSHIYQMLVLYKANDDVLRAIDCPSESERIFQQMRLNFEGIFDGIKCTIKEILSGTQCTITQVGHPVTKFLVRTLKLFASHSSTVQDTCVGEGSSSLGHHLSQVISYWAEQLVEKFMSYAEAEGRNDILLLNNLTHFDEETTTLLQKLMASSEPNSGPGYIVKLLIEMNTGNYLESWGQVRDILISGEQPCWASLIKFRSQFNIVYKRQKLWVLQNQLKSKLRQEIEDFLVPLYDTFLKKLKKSPFARLRLSIQRAEYMTIEDLRCAISGMFESEHIE